MNIQRNGANFFLISDSRPELFEKLVNRFHNTFRIEQIEFSSSPHEGNVIWSAFILYHGSADEVNWDVGLYY